MKLKCQRRLCGKTFEAPKGNKICDCCRDHGFGRGKAKRNLNKKDLELLKLSEKEF